MTAPTGSRRQFRLNLEPWLARALVIAILTNFGIAAVRPFVAYRALSLGAGPVQVGLLASAFSILSVVVALPVGRWTDRYGAERFVLFAAVIMAVAATAMVFANSLLLLGLVYMVSGLGHTMNLVAQQTSIGNRGGRSGRDARYGYYTSALSVGQMLGPAIAGILVTVETSVGPFRDLHLSNVQAPVFLLSAACAGAAAILAMPAIRATTMRRAPDSEPASSNVLATAGRVLRRPGMLRAMLASTITVSSIDVLVAYLPLYGQNAGLSAAFVGFLLSIRAASTLVSRVFLGEGVVRVGRRSLLGLGLAAASASMLVIAVSPGSWVLLPSMVVFGLGIGISQPITVSWVAELAPRAERATAIGVRLMGNRFALLTLPLVTGLVAGSVGVAMTFVVVAGLLAAGSGAVVSSGLSAGGAPGNPGDTPSAST